MLLQANTKITVLVLFWAGSNVAQIRELEAPDLVNQLVVEMLDNE